MYVRYFIDRYIYYDHMHYMLQFNFVSYREGVRSNPLTVARAVRIVGFQINKMLYI